MKNELISLIENEHYLITLLSNTAAFFNEKLDRINWVGYYLVEDNQLILGPFQGKPACEIIPFSKGVCGKAAREEKTIRVENVHLFEGHIACDSASQSELVIPIIINHQLFGLLDIDSPDLNRFSIEDQLLLEECVNELSKKIAKIKESR